MPQSDLIIRIGADVKRLTDGLDQANRKLRRFAFRAESVGRDLTTRLTLPIAAVGTAAVRSFAQFDRLEKGLSAIAGSASEGARQFDSLLNIVKDTQTTLDLRTAASASLQLQAVGVSAADAERTIKQLGIAATVSGKGVEDVGGVVRQFGQILARGKVEQEDFNTIVERLPVLAGLIRSEFGVSTAEGVRGLGISMEDFVSRLTAAAEQSSAFQNAQGGLAKAIESFGIEVQIAGKELGQTIAESINLEQVLKDLSSFISRVTEGFKSLSPEMQRFIVISAGIAAAAGPVTFALGSIAKILPLLTSGFKTLTSPIRGVVSLVGNFGGVLSAARAVLAAITGPIGLIVAGITLLAASFRRAFQRSETFRKTIQPLINIFKNVGGAIAGVARSVIPDFSGVLSGLGSVVDVVLASVAAFGAGLIKFVAEPIKFIGRQIRAFQLALSGDLKGALESFKSSFADFGKESAETFVNVFSETLQEELPKKVNRFDPTGLFIQDLSNSPLPSGIAAPSTNEEEGTTQTTQTTVLSRNVDVVNQIKTFTDATLAVGQYESGLIAARESALSFNNVLSGLQANAALPSPVDAELIADLEKLRENNLAYSQELDILNNKNLVFGDSFDLLGERIALVQGILTQTLEEGYSPYGEAVQNLVSQLRELNEEQEKSTAGFTRFQGVLASGLTGALNSVGSIFDQLAQSSISFAQAATKAIREVIGALIQQGVAAAVANTLKGATGLLGPLAIPAAAAAGKLANAAFQSLLTGIGIPALAEGGITTGATLALIGEAGTEVVMPLDRLNQFVRDQNSGGEVTGTIRASGQELLVVIDNARRAQNRAF